MDQLAVIALIIAGYTLFVLVFPTRPCRCAGRCRRCKGSGRRFRIGARLVRRAISKAHKEARTWGKAPRTR